LVPHKGLLPQLNTMENSLTIWKLRVGDFNQVY
jgi:hypothetical protein